MDTSKLGSKRYENFASIFRTFFWPNQYENENNLNAHYFGTGQEICERFEQLDYAFIGVGSAGTISGVSARLKERFPHVKIVAVDAVGSVIFGAEPRTRRIPGIGSSIVPPLLRKARIDDVVWVSDLETIGACHELRRRHHIFAGGSSGSSYAAIQRYFRDQDLLPLKPTVLFLCVDGGELYNATIYNNQWVADLVRTHSHYSFEQGVLPLPRGGAPNISDYPNRMDNMDTQQQNERGR
ncbi:MAG: pyridoxal-phosphate dependent enzyme [Bdellovibrionota bacterium]